MKLKATLLGLLALALYLPSLSQSTGSYNALFIGNSYTYGNNLPVLLSELFTAGGDTLTSNSSTPGGSTFEAHSTNGTTLNYLAQGNYDFVIMQEQSQRPSFPPSQVANEVYPFAQILVDSARSANPCVEPVFFMTWGRKYGDTQNCQFYPPLCTYEGMQDRLRTSYVQMANDNNCTVSPVGMAFAESKLQDSTLNLYTADNSHPSYAGSYLAGCVFYATLLRKSPMGLNYYGSLDSATAVHLQQIADKVVLDSMDQWRIGANDVVAAFSMDTSMISTGAVQFTDNSLNATSWHWDFGNGTTDSVANPSATYGSDGPYLVTLIVDNGCMSDTILDTVQVTLVGLEQELPFGLSVYPNPGDGMFKVDLDLDAASPLDLRVYNLAGAKIFEWQEARVPAGTWRHAVDLGDVVPGMYLMEIELGDRKLHHKIVVR